MLVKWFEVYSLGWTGVIVSCLKTVALPDISFVGLWARAQRRHIVLDTAWLLLGFLFRKRSVQLRPCLCDLQPPCRIEQSLEMCIIASNPPSTLVPLIISTSYSLIRRLSVRLAVTSYPSCCRENNHFHTLKMERMQEWHRVVKCSRSSSWCANTHRCHPMPFSC